MKRIELKVGGMHCGHCLEAVRNALSAVPGVFVEDVHIGAAVLSVDEARVRTATLIDAVDDAGYQAEEVTP